MSTGWIIRTARGRAQPGYARPVGTSILSAALTQSGVRGIDEE